MLKSSCDRLLSPRTSTSSCLQVRSLRSRSFTRSRYRALLASPGPSAFFLLSTTTTELWGVEDSAASLSMGVEPSCLLLLLLELPLESTLPPKRSPTGLAGKKEGRGWTKCELTSFHQIRLKNVYVLLEETVQPLRAPGLVEVNAVRGSVFRKGILHHSCYVKQSHGQYTSLLILPNDFVDMAYSFIHVTSVLVVHHNVWDGANGEYC